MLNKLFDLASIATTILVVALAIDLIIIIGASL